MLHSYNPSRTNHRITLSQPHQPRLNFTLTANELERVVHEWYLGDAMVVLWVFEVDVWSDNPTAA